MENNKHNLHTALLLILVVLSSIIIWMLSGSSRKESVKQFIDNTPKAGEIAPPVTKPTTTKPVVTPASITVNINQQFTISLNQTVVIAGASATITLTGFYNHPCPPNANCIWSGQDILYTIKDTNTGAVYVKDQPLEQVHNIPFNVIVKSSDYTTSADIVVVRSDGVVAQ
jgi:hypothetical protein